MAAKLKLHLMFEGDAEAALRLYCTVFADSEILSMERYGPAGPGTEHSVMRADARIAGQDIVCIDSPIHHDFTFTPATSLFVDCDTEEELREAYEQLVEGGQALMPLDDYGFSQRFGWVQDRFGVSWQLNLP